MDRDQLLNDILASFPKIRIYLEIIEHLLDDLLNYIVEILFKQ